MDHTTYFMLPQLKQIPPDLLEPLLLVPVMALFTCACLKACSSTSNLYRPLNGSHAKLTQSETLRDKHCFTLMDSVLINTVTQ